MEKSMEKCSIEGTEMVLPELIIEDVSIKFLSHDLLSFPLKPSVNGAFT